METVRTKTPSCFPSAEDYDNHSVERGQANLAKVQTDAITVACGSVIADELTTLQSMLDNIQTGPPARPTVQCAIWVSYMSLC